MKSLNESKGITLIALIITIIVLLILAGVVINMTLGNDGIISKAQGAVDMYKNATEKEEIELAKIANDMAGYVDGDRGTVTLTDTQYNELISRIENLEKTVQPTGITGAYLEDRCTGAVGANININSKTKDVTTNASTSTDGFYRVNTEGNISTYLSYSTDDGYTVLKEGWYLVDLSAYVKSNTTADSRTWVNFVVDGRYIMSACAFSNNDTIDCSSNVAPVYLKKNSKFYIEITGNNNAASYRRGDVCISPMF